MFPDTEDRPTHDSKAFSGIGVPHSIRIDFLLPEPSVLLGPRGMQRTPMPKAPVDEDGDFLPGERYVSCSSRLSKYFEVDAVAKSSGEQFST